MESVKEKTLLYYDCYKRLPRHYNGSPIDHFIFKDVKTGEEVVLGSCFYNEQVSQLMGGYYYEEITDAANDFDILWNLSDSKISVVAKTFEEVQQEYQRMVSEGISPEEINAAMMKFYGVKPITRKL